MSNSRRTRRNDLPAGDVKRYYAVVRDVATPDDGMLSVVFGRRDVVELIPRLF